MVKAPGTTYFEFIVRRSEIFCKQTGHTKKSKHNQQSTLLVYKYTSKASMCQKAFIFRISYLIRCIEFSHKRTEGQKNPKKLTKVLCRRTSTLLDFQCAGYISNFQFSGTFKFFCKQNSYQKNL